MKVSKVARVLPGPAIFLVLCLVLASCSSVSHYERIDGAVQKNDYAQGLALVKASKESDYSAKDRVLYYLDAGMLAHYANDGKESIGDLSEAERDIEEAYTKSITQEASTYLVNDNTRDYAGEDYEDIYLNVFKTLEYVRANNYEDAMVEVRRADNKIQFLATKYNKSIEDAKQEAKSHNGSIDYNVDTSPVRFTDSALARYLSIIFYRAKGNLDDAGLDQRKLVDDFRSEAALYNFPLPSSVNGELSVPAGQARLNVLAFSGLSPVKEEVTTRIFLGNDHWMKIAVPVIKNRPSMVRRVELDFETGQVVNLERLENISAVAKETFRLKASLIYLKTVIRALVKTAASVALDKGSHQASDSNAAAALSVLSFATQAYSELSEQADLRISHYFPSQADVAGINLPPGSYSFTVKFFDGQGRILGAKRFDNYQVVANGVNLVEGVCLK